MNSSTLILLIFCVMMLGVGYASAGVLGLWGTALGLILGPPIATLITHWSEIVEAAKKASEKETEKEK